MIDAGEVIIFGHCEDYTIDTTFKKMNFPVPMKMMAYSINILKTISTDNKYYSNSRPWENKDLEIEDDDWITDIQSSSYHTCVITHKNKIIMYGMNDDGQMLQDGRREPFHVDITLLPELRPCLHLPNHYFKVALGLHNSYIYVVQRKPDPTVLLSLYKLNFSDIIIN
jgi:hypothetical protein